ncbi:MAG: cation:proton antiporter [Deltaproteobacteria bacterium]
MGFLDEKYLFTFLLQVFLLLGLARGLGELFRRLRQPPLAAEILVGVILGPTVFGRFLPDLYSTVFPADPYQMEMLGTVAWLGIFFLLLEVGLETDFTSAWRQRGDALTIAVTDVIVPLALGFCASMLLPAKYFDPSHRVLFAMFMATAMSITAMPITARALHDLNISKTDLGFLIMSALSVNDIIGWAVFTVVIGLFAQANVAFGTLIFILAALVLFSTACLTIGRRFADRTLERIKGLQMPEPGASLTFICLLGLLSGALTAKLGVNALFGFFLAGIMAGQSRYLSERTRQVISQMVYAVFVPLFFAGIGLRMDFFRNFDLLLVLFVTVISMTGKFLGAWIGVRFTRQPKSNRLPIAICHIPGGTIELVLALAALHLGLIKEPVFIAIVVGAIVSSMVMVPWLARSLKQRKEISLLEFFPKRAIMADLPAASRDQAIALLCKAAAEQAVGMEEEDIYRAVLKRENEMGTALENEIAVPHARLSVLKTPVVAFGRSLQGIDWNSPDGKQTRLVFLILTPPEDDSIQVQILRLIARTMSEEANRDEVLRARDRDQIWELLHKFFTKTYVRTRPLPDKKTEEKFGAQTN